MSSRQNPKYVITKRDNDPELMFKPTQVEYSYYQICAYPNDGFYELRKIIYNEHYEAVDIYEKFYPKKKIESFLRNTLEHKYRMYPTRTIKTIALPNPEQIICANSSLLNN
jgi:hypothetical protein